MKIGDPYIPLQIVNATDEQFNLKTDDDFTISTRYGRFHIIVKDCKIVKYEKIDE